MTLTISIRAIDTRPIGGFHQMAHRLWRPMRVLFTPASIEALSVVQYSSPCAPGKTLR